MELGAVVSRKDVFDQSDNDAENTATFFAAYEFEEVDVGHSANNQEQEENDGNDASLMDFRLFGGDDEITTVNLDAKPQEIHQSRPQSYYFYQPSSSELVSFKVSAVTGDFVIKEAAFWKSRSAQNPPAPDINANWVPPKRRCRPGKSARLNKKLRNERIDQENKERRLRFQKQRRMFKFKPKPGKK